MKTCTKCGETKPTTEFGKHVRRPDGLNDRCKECSNAAQSAYRAANPDKVKSCNAAWRAANPEQDKARKAAWRAANHNKVKSSKEAWRAANKDKERDRRSVYRAAHLDKEKANAAAWRAANKEVRRIYEQNRRARKRASGGKLSPGLADRLFKLQRGKCACCHVSIEDGNHLDHVIPLALEGPNEDWNMQLLCGPCNLSKNAKHPVEFMQQRGFLL